MYDSAHLCCGDGGGLYWEEKKKSAHRQPSRTPNKAFYKGLLILTLFSGNVPEMFRKISGNVPGMLLFHALVPEQACSRNVP